MDESQKPRKNNKTLLVVIIAALIIIAGGALAYFLTKDDESTTANDSGTSSSTQPTEQAANNFSPAAMAKEPFVATINTTVDGKNVKGVMTSDGQGNISYAYKTDGKTLTLTYTKDFYYLCTEGAGCFKYPLSQSGTSGFDPSQYQYDSSRLSNLKNSASYKGTQACPVGGGTCDVWSVSVASTTSTMYVNTSNKRIMKVTSTTGTTTSDITYDYKSATVTIPQNAVSLPSNH